MRQYRCGSVRGFWVLLAASLAALSAARPVQSAEAFQAFLDSLRDRKFYDMAIEYLDRSKTNAALDPADKERLLFEQGKTYVEWARFERDATAKNKLLDDARAKYEQFAKENTSHPLVAMAETEMGNILVERAKSLLETSQNPKQAATKDVLIKQARDLFTQAEKVFEEAEKKFKARADSFPKTLDPKDPKQEAVREQRRLAHSDHFQVQLYLAQVPYEMSKTYAPMSKEAKDQLQKAADRYGDIANRYRTILAGIIAKISRGMCYQEMGQLKLALSTYGEVAGQPDDAPAFRPLIARALHFSMQCWVTPPDPKDLLLEVAVEKGKAWVDKARGEEEHMPDWIGVRYYIALAHKMLADRAENEAGKKPHLAEALKEAALVKKNPGEYKDRAEKLWSDVSGRAAAGDKPPTTFADAAQRGKAFLDAMTAAQEKKAVAPTMKDEANIPKYEQEEADNSAKALEMYREALRLKDASSPLEEVNAVRYYLCYLYYKTGQLYEAAILGEFLAKHYPNEGGARPSAKIAMASYLSQYNQAPEDQRDFDRRGMLEIANFITLRWKGEADADEAWGIMISVATSERRLEDALKYLENIPAESPRRGEAELKSGQALWLTYLSGVKLKVDDPTRPPQAELDKMVKQAEGILEAGIARMRKPVDDGTGAVTYTLASAGLSLAQIYVNSGQPEKAIAKLEDAKIGPLTLVEKKDPASITPTGTNKNAFATETYKLALRAYVATQALEKAEKAMNDLEQVIGGDADAAKLLTQIYVSLGYELQEQIKLLREQNNTDQLNKVSKGFELFLERISSREQGNSFKSLNWVADTYYNLGAGFDSATGKVPAEAKAYFDKALAADTKLLAKVKADAKFVDPDDTARAADAALAIQLRMGKCCRRADKFQEAIPHFVEVLKQRAMLLDAQKEAAYTFQDWGEADPAYYLKAMAGDVVTRDPKTKAPANVIWGWAKMGNLLYRDPKYDQVFFEARYNLGVSHWRWADKQPGEKRKAELQKAESSVLYTLQLKPLPTTDDWYKKYETLVKNIQKSQGKQPTGVPKPSASPAAKSSTQAAAK